MKKFLILSLTLLAVLTQVRCQNQPKKSPDAVAESATAKVVYNQPAKRGRAIFGSLVPYGQWWRTGANAATLITFKKDVKVAGSPVKAGTYTLYTIPTADKWTIIINGQTGQWGTEYDKTKDVVRVEVPSKSVNAPLESFTISFVPGGANTETLRLAWDTTQVDVPLVY